MKGFPKHLNSKFDYYYIKQNFPALKWKPYWQRLLDERYRWMDDHELTDPAQGIIDDTHRVEERHSVDQSTGEEITTWMQVVYKENPGSDFWRMNFTVEEVERALEDA